MRHLIILTGLTSLALLPAGRAASAQGFDDTNTIHERMFHFDDHWVALTRFASGGKTIALLGKDRRIDVLRLQADQGAPMILRVLVQYADGGKQHIQVNAQLQPDNERVITLDGDRPVSKITVIADPRYGGAYSLFGG